MSRSEIELAVLQQLAAVLGRDETAVRKELEEAGNEWPCDSIVLVEVVTILEESLDFRLPMDADTAKALRSVRGLVARIDGVCSGEATYAG